MKKLKTTPADARQTALTILSELDKKRQTLDAVLEDIFGKDCWLQRRDRAFANALVYGVIRWREDLDWIIDHFSKTCLNKIDPFVLNILRIGVFQIKYLDRVPDSAAVNTSVELAKSVAAPWVVRYVNGLLRNVTRNYKSIPYPDINKTPAEALSVSKSFPLWLIQRWLDRFGLETTSSLCDATNIIPPITLRTNTLKISRKNLIKELEGMTEKITSTEYSPDGISFSSPDLSIPEMECFQNGYFQVQDEAAQIVSLLLSPEPGQTVLDACAGLGGKTGHIAQLMKNSGSITVMDKNRNKLLQLKNEINRLGISIVKSVQHNLDQPPDQLKSSRFDCILLDAPCTGLGVLRRNPDTKWSASEKDLLRCKQRQIKFLNNIANLVKPAGVIVYAVCSTELEENEQVIDAFLTSHPEFKTEKRPTLLPGKISSLIDENGFIKTSPDKNNMDGFFAACLRRNS